ncbi:kinase-like protein, partial [Rhizophagus irregularis]
WLATGLKCLHELGYFHKDLHSGNILQTSYKSHISDFGLSGLSNKQKSDDKICGVLPYIAPEVLNGESYTLLSDIYSFALEICNGLRPEFGKGTPEIYKKLAYKCMNANSNQRPTASKLRDVFYFWVESLHSGLYKEVENFGYKGKEIKAIFKEADKEIPNISSSYEKNPDAIYIPENNKDCQDSQLFDLEKHVIEAEIITGNLPGTRVFIPRIMMSPSDTDLPFIFKRRQFPVQPTFAITIIKPQGKH